MDPTSRQFVGRMLLSEACATAAIRPIVHDGLEQFGTAALAIRYLFPWHEIVGLQEHLLDLGLLLITDHRARLLTLTVNTQRRGAMPRALQLEGRRSAQQLVILSDNDGSVRVIRLVELSHIDIFDCDVVDARHDS